MEPMKLAIPITCARHSHRYYRESGTDTPCPFCLLRDLTLMRQSITRISDLHAVMKGELNAARQNF